MVKKSSLLLVLSGLGLGCAAGATGAAVAVSWAGPSAGKWQCYGVNELPDMAKAEAEARAPRIAQGLNEAAPSSPLGTVIQMSQNGDDHNYLCAKN